MWSTTRYGLTIWLTCSPDSDGDTTGASLRFTAGTELQLESWASPPLFIDVAATFKHSEPRRHWIAREETHIEPVGRPDRGRGVTFATT